MAEKAKKNNRSSISEEDVSTVLQRYSPTSVLALLQEVAQVPEGKIDWNALVKNTVTGISNAREYQMLWRHMAYRHALSEKLEEEAEPLEDDSDLEYELEPLPAVSSESLNEVAACVKVLIASGFPKDSSVPNSSTVEAPLTINLSYNQSARLENSEPACSTQGTYITIPVSVQRQPAPAPSSVEGFDANVTSNGIMPSRRKRKPWSEAEDLELIAAVQKCGEGNWANILRGDFKGDRTASQLSQRWAIIRKRHSNLNVGGNSTGTQLSEDQVEAARRAMSLALDMPVNNVKAICTANSECAVRATAVAAGARIASPSDAASLLKAAQGKNAIHIMPTGAGSTKSSISGGGSIPSESRPNVHYISTLKSANSLATYPPITPHALRVNPAKTLSSTVQHKLSNAAASSNLSDPKKNVSYNTAAEPSIKQETKIPIAGEKLKQEETQEDEACAAAENAVSEKVQAEKTSSPTPEAESESQTTGVDKSCSPSLNIKIAGNDQSDRKEWTGDNEKASSLKNQSPEEHCDSRSVGKKLESGIDVICDDAVGRKEHTDDNMVMDVSIDSAG